MGEPARVVAVYLIRGEDPLLGWADGEMYLFIPHRVEVRIIEGVSETIEIDGVKVGFPAEAASVVYDDNGGSPLSDAPMWARGKLNAVRRMLNERR